MKGFSLIELIVSIAIMSTITTMGILVFINLSEEKKIKNDSQLLVTKLSEVKVKAYSNQKVNDQVPKAFGLAVESTNLRQFIIYADENGDCLHAASETVLETIELSERIYFGSVPAIGSGICFETEKNINNVCRPILGCGIAGTYSFYLVSDKSSEQSRVEIDLSSGIAKMHFLGE
ncbi:prepilin-type N-terminal cleavage/methylation domain-containing protein [Candidatus Kuenenbacteria bacterium]|nr:prepilin-type N-terminal cleavage/methylation domain-containing protein [Candidatus Kuenenbacteria bacterium]